MNALTLLVTLSAAAAVSADHHHGTKVGSFRNHVHGIAGDVYAVDEHTLFIKDFEYDGAGPDAFFWVGTSGAPSAVGTILPYPFAGKFYEYEDNSAPILSRRFNKEDITLTLPPELKTTDLKWISVWCRAFKVNFGDLTFPADLELKEEGAHAEAEAEAESESEPEGEAEGELPPPLLPPRSNAHDPHHRHHDDDADAEAESEAESGYAEGEAEPSTGKDSGAAATGLSVSVLANVVVAVLVTRW